MKRRRSFIRKMGLSGLAILVAKFIPATEIPKLGLDETCASRAGSCPGYIDCQGFVPPCKNCNDPSKWNTIATKRKDQSFKNFWTITRLKFSNFFKPNSK